MTGSIIKALQKAAHTVLPNGVSPQFTRKLIGAIYKRLIFDSESQTVTIQNGLLAGLRIFGPFKEYSFDLALGKYEPEVNAIWPLLVSEAFAKKSPKIVEGLVRADLDLHKYVQSNLDDAAQVVYKELEEKIPLPVLKASLASYRYSDKLDAEAVETMKRGIDFMKSKGFIKTGFDPAAWADPSYADKILSGKK